MCLCSHTVSHRRIAIIESASDLRIDLGKVLDDLILIDLVRKSTHPVPCSNVAGDHKVNSEANDLLSKFRGGNIEKTRLTGQA